MILHDRHGKHTAVNPTYPRRLSRVDIENVLNGKQKHQTGRCHQDINVYKIGPSSSPLQACYATQHAMFMCNELLLRRPTLGPLIYTAFCFYTGGYPPVVAVVVSKLSTGTSSMPSSSAQMGKAASTQNHTISFTSGTHQNTLFFQEGRKNVIPMRDKARRLSVTGFIGLSAF